MGEAVRLLVGEGRVDHLDMNFGCPVRKVTSKGGGAAIPLKPRLLRNIVRAAVEAAGAVPVTIKFRIGIDERYQTYLEAGRIGQEEGCAAVGLHARTAAQLYDGEARWEAIAELKQAVTRIPVLGNGDVWEAEDALRMMRATGCDGVIVGRGCLGRPWLFRDLAERLRRAASPENPPRPRRGRGRHARARAAPRRLARRRGRGDAGLPQALELVHEVLPRRRPLRQRLMQVLRLDELAEVLSVVDRALPYPPEAMRVPRGKTGGTQKVALPEGYLDHLDDDTSARRRGRGRGLGGVGAQRASASRSRACRA